MKNIRTWPLLIISNFQKLMWTMIVLGTNSSPTTSSSTEVLPCREAPCKTPKNFTLGSMSEKFGEESSSPECERILINRHSDGRGRRHYSTAFILLFVKLYLSWLTLLTAGCLFHSSSQSIFTPAASTQKSAAGTYTAAIFWEENKKICIWIK